MNLAEYLDTLNHMLDDAPSQAAFSLGQHLILINGYIPYVGIVLIVIAVLFRRFITKGAVVSSILHLYLLMFMMLIWSDGASYIFTPSRQSVLARLLLIVIVMLTILHACRTKKIQNQLKLRLRVLDSDNRRLSTINEQLKIQLKQTGTAKKHTQ